MASLFTVVCTQRGKWRVGWIEGVPSVNAQQSTRPELPVSLKVILTEILAFYRGDARAAA